MMNNTPSVVLENVKQANDLPIIIRFDALYLACREKGVLDGNHHNLGEELAVQLPQCIENPDAIVLMDNGRIGLFSVLKSAKGNNRIVSIEMNTVKDVNNEYKKYNLVVTVFAAKDNYTKNTIVKHGVKIAYEKEGLPQVNPQLHEWLAIINGIPSKDIEPQSGADVNTQYMQNLRKNSIPTLADPADTAETSIADTVSEEPKTLDQFTDEQLRAEMRRRHPKGDIGDIANLKPEDASTTPDLTSSGVRNRNGDGESAFAGSLQGADIFDNRLKDLTATDDKISRYDRIANKETMEVANKALNDGGRAYVNEWMSKKTTAFTAEDVARITSP